MYRLSFLWVFHRSKLFLFFLLSPFPPPALPLLHFLPSHRLGALRVALCISRHVRLSSSSSCSSPLFAPPPSLFLSRRPRCLSTNAFAPPRAPCKCTPTMLPLFLHASLKNEDLQPLVIRVPRRLAASRSWSRRPRRRASSPSENQARAKETSLVVDVDLDGNDAADGEERFR